MSANTAQGVIAKAYVDAGKLARGGTPSTAQYADGLDRLNDIINLVQTRGLRLWLEEEYTLALTVGKQAYSFGAAGDVVMDKPLRVKQAAYLDSSGNLRPLTPYAREEWTRLANRTAAGSINGYFVEKHAALLTVSLWQVPDATSATGTVQLVLQLQATNPTVVAQETAFPIEWVMYLRWALAADLATGMPEQILSRAERNAERYLGQLDDWDVEDAPTYFQLNTQAAPASRFR